MFELTAEAEAIAGPSKPTEPPNPTVSGAVINGVNILLRFNSPFFFDKEYSIDGIACSIGFFDTCFTNK